MTAKIHTGVPVLSLFTRQLWPVFWALSAGLLSGAETKSAPPEPKTHTLFMGADLSVEYNKTMYRVQDVQASAFVIKVGGKEVRVDADWSKIVLKVDRTLKLTDTSAAVNNLKSERAYTLANDPTVRFERGLASAELQYADNRASQAQSAAGFKFGDITMAADRAAAAAAAGAGGGTQTPSASDQDASRAANMVTLKAQKVAGGPGSTFHESGSIFEGEGMFDAMEVTFEVSAEEPLNNPYVVFLGQFREKDGKPGNVANWVYAQPLQPITRETKKIRIERGGFPPGFELLEFQLHLYNRGKEIATDVAPKRVPLSRQEAFTYALMEYLSSHKGATTTANPFMGKLTPETKARLNAAQLEQPYYVKVSKDGVPIAAFSDTSCSRPVDGTVASLIENVRFYPALEKGKPVEGVAELKFTRLVL